MKKSILFIVLFFGILIPLGAQSETLADGEYIGLKPMANLDPGDKGAKWFHEQILTIHGDHAAIDASPVYFKHGERIDSASDGGFYSYSGTVIRKDKKTDLHLVYEPGEYSLIPMKLDPEKAKQYPDYKKWTIEEQWKKDIWVRDEPKPFEKEIKPTKDGCVFDGVRYKLKYAFQKVEKGTIEQITDIPKTDDLVHAYARLKVRTAQGEMVELLRWGMVLFKDPKIGAPCDIYYHSEDIQDVAAGEVKGAKIVDVIDPVIK